MDDLLQKVYLSQVVQECKYCFNAVAALNAIIEKRAEGDFVQPALDLVNHAAAVSRIFWPSRSRNKHSHQRALRRGVFLRKVLCLPSGHAVQNRSLRDHFEHFDERLDDWAENSKHRSMVQLIGPRKAVGGPAIEDSDIIHHYDPSSKIFSFRGEQFDFQALLAGLNDIYQKANEKLRELEANRLQRIAEKAGSR